MVQVSKEYYLYGWIKSVQRDTEKLAIKIETNAMRLNREKQKVLNFS